MRATRGEDVSLIALIVTFLVARVLLWVLDAVTMGGRTGRSRYRTSEFRDA